MNQNIKHCTEVPTLHLLCKKVSIPKCLFPVSWQDGQSNPTIWISSYSEKRIIMVVSSFTSIFWPRGLPTCYTVIGFREREQWCLQSSI